MDALERREAGLSPRSERERRNRALESARLAGRRVRDRVLRAAQSTAALQRRRERGFRAEFTYVRTYVHVCTAAYARHPQTRSGSPHNACISLVYI